MQGKLFLVIFVLNCKAIESLKDLDFTWAVDRNWREKNLHRALSQIVQENFINMARSLKFFACFDRNRTKNFYIANDLIDGVVGDILEHSYNIEYNRQKLFYNLYHNEVVILDSIETFRHFFSKITYIGNLDLTRTVLFIPTLTRLDDKSIYFIFKEFYDMETLNVALVVMLENGDIFLLTYFPFTRAACRDFKPVVINRFLADQQRWEGDSYFPKKLDDFFGCPIHICTWEQMPYFRLTSRGEDSTYDGMEAEPLQFAASAINASVKIKLIDPINESTDDLETILSKLFSQQCQMALGGFGYRRDFDTTRFSQTRFFTFSHIFIVTNTINIYTIYDKLAYPFDNSVWLALGLTFAGSILLVSIYKWQCQRIGSRNFLTGYANCTPQFNLYTLAVGSNITANHLPKRNFARFLLTCWLILTFILRSAYQSGMYQMLRDNKEWNPPQSIANVFGQKYLITTTTASKKYLEILPHTKQVHIFNTTAFEAFAEMVAAKEPIALVVPYEYYGYLYKTNLSLWRNLHLVKERLVTKQLTFYSPHHSYLVPLFNKKLSYGFAHGLLSLWKSRNILEFSTALRYKHSIKNERSENKNGQTNLLTMNELGAIFMILIWLHIIAVAVFLIETIWQRYGNFLKDYIYY